MDIASFSRYLRSQGYRTRTTWNSTGTITYATKRQADHIQTYAYPVHNSDRQPGALWVDTFGLSVEKDGIYDSGCARSGWIDGRDLRGPWGTENAIRESGGLDYYGPAEPAIYA